MMTRLPVLSLVSFFVGINNASAGIDMQCVNNCTSRGYQYQLCQQRCSYDMNAGQAPQPQINTNIPMQGNRVQIDSSIPMRGMQPVPQVQPMGVIDINESGQQQPQQLTPQIQQNVPTQSQPIAANPTIPRPIYNSNGDWYKVQSDSDGTRYVELSTLQKNGEIVKVWIINDLQSPKGFGKFGTLASTEFLDEFNCKEKQMRMHAYTWYAGHMGSGNVLGLNNRDVESPKWEAIKPSAAMNNALLNYVCGDEVPKTTSEQTWLSKYKELCSKTEFAELIAKSSCLGGEISFEQLADETKITKQQKLVFLQYRTQVEDLNKAVQEWRRTKGDNKEKKLADYVDTQLSEIDKYSLDLYKGKITWGSYNQQRKDLTAKMSVEFRKTLQ